MDENAGYYVEVRDWPEMSEPIFKQSTSPLSDSVDVGSSKLLYTLVYVVRHHIHTQMRDPIYTE